MPTIRRTSLTLALVAIAACQKTPTPGPAPSPAPATRATVPDRPPGERLITAMRDRYAGKWYTTFTFVQKTTITSPATGSLVQTWYEAGSLPGKLRIDVGDPARGDGSLYRGDSSYRITAGKVTAVRADRNELLVLGFDVYTQPPAATIKVMRDRGFDLAKSHDRMWQGKAVTVIGALAGDTTSRQFWVEKERLLFVRLITPSPQGSNDIRFNQYIPMQSGWMAVDVVQLVAGKPRLHEEYSDVRVNVPLDPALFDPRSWKTARHWRPR